MNSSGRTRLYLKDAYKQRINKAEDKIIGEDDMESLPELVTCLTGLVNSNQVLEIETHIQDSNDEELVTEIQEITDDAFEKCCERSHPLFIHMLITFVGINPNAIIGNNMLHTKPVHCAAAKGKNGTLLYLHYTHNTPLDHVDKNQNNPAHLAYLQGKIDTGNLLIHLKPELKEKKNSSGRTRLYLKDAYKQRINKAEELQRHKVYGPKAREICKDMYDTTDEFTLAELHWELLYLRKKARGMDFRDLAMELPVDFENGEAQVISQNVIDFVNRLIDIVGQRDPLLKGIWQFL